jgi:hypothetical protein
MYKSFSRLVIDKTLNFSDSFKYSFVAVLLTQCSVIWTYKSKCEVCPYMLPLFCKKKGLTATLS